MPKRTRTKKPKVAILTSLIDYSPAYSLVGIILDQCLALKRAGYDYDLLCLKAFKRKGEDPFMGPEVAERLGISVRYILPQTRLHDYKPNEAAKDPHKEKSGAVVLGFEQQVGVHLNGDKEKGWVGYLEALEPYDVIIDHDLMFLSWHLPQNKALRACIDRWPEKNWLHWVHSGPSVPPPDLCYPSTLRFSAAPHSTYVYLNNRQANDYALMINAPRKVVRTVYNPKDVRDVWGFDDLTGELIDRYDLMDHQILQVYPFSTPRWRDKGVRQLLKVFANWKKQKVKAKLVLVNAHCNSPQDQKDVDAIEAYAQVCGLELDEDVVMTSRFADERGNKALRYTVPFRTVRELVMVSNLFMFPSVSECCSLIQAEASMAGKFMILNRDFPPMLEFCTDNVLHYEFTKNDPDANPVYYECVAREVWANLQQESSIINRTRAITQTYNRDWIFRNQLEPLLYLRFSEKAVPAEPREERRPAQADGFVEGPGGERIPLQIVRDGEGRPLTRRRKDPTVGDCRTYADTVNPETGELEPVEDYEVEGMEEAEVVIEAQPGTPPINYSDPFDGMDCEVFGVCSSEQKVRCYEEAGHCLMLDQIDHQKRLEADEKRAAAKERQK